METLEKLECKKCGATLAEDTVFCPKCGTPVQEKVVSCEPAEKALRSKIQISKKWIAIGVGALVAIGIVGGIVCYNQLPMPQFSRQLNGGNYDEAIQVYLEYRHDDKFVKEADAKLSACEESIAQKYLSKEITLEDATTQLTALDSVVDCSDTLDSCNAVEASRTTFAEGQAAVESKDYDAAFAAFEKVVEADTENFDAASQLKATVCESVCAEAIASADELLKQQDYDGAYKVLRAVKKSYVTEPLTEKQADIQAEADTFIQEKAQKLLDEKKYVEAYQCIKKWPTYLKTSKAADIAEEAQRTYGNNVLADANVLAGDGKYQDAINLIETAEKELSINGAKLKKDGYQKQIDTTTLTNLKSQVYVEYDEIGKAYWVRTKGNPELGDSGRNIFAELLKTKDFPWGFILRPYFFNKDWIFTDSVLIDCNETQYKYELDYDKQERQVVWGGIYEWTNLFYMPSEPAALDSGFAHDFNKLIPAMNAASKVTIRFSGDEGRKDVVIPKSHIAEINTLWQVFQVLDRNPELLSILQG